MNLSNFLVISLMGLLLFPVMGQLPSLNEKSYIGKFMAYERRDFSFIVKVDGKMLLWPNLGRNESVAFFKSINILAEVTQESHGKTQNRQIIPVTLSSQDGPTREPTKTRFTGKVTGDAEFEVMIDYQRDQVIVGGRLIHQGKLIDPRFQIRVKFGDLYRSQSDKELLREARRERLEYVRWDDKKGKVGVIQNIDLSSDAVTGQGLKRVEVDLSPYEGRAFVFETQGASKLVLENPRRMASPAKDGFSVIWQGDAKNDPKSEARMVITVK